MAEHIKTWVELVSDGSPGGSHVYLVISAGSGTEFRYEIPGVSTASWFCHPPAKAQLQLVLTDAVMKTRTEIDSSTVKLEELMTEIVASRLAHDDDDRSMKWNQKLGHEAHCAIVIGHRLDDRCDCGAVLGGRRPCE